MDIQQKIRDQLMETTQRYNVQIPIAIESGSRGWGFASPDSDYDCRFIYVHEKDWYLTVFDKKDVIEYAADPIFDVNGWDIRKVLKHIVKSNGVMFEWLSSNVVYLKNEEVQNILMRLAIQFFNPLAVSYHYLSSAKNKLHEVVRTDSEKLKKYFYILRPIANLNFIEQYGKMPYMEYDRTLQAIEMDFDILKEIESCTALKKIHNEGFEIPQSLILLEYFHREIQRHEERLKMMKFEKNRCYEDVDQAFRKILEMVWA